MLYSADGLRRGHATTCLGRNQLFPSSIGLSPLDTGHASDLQISTANGPPRNFRHASTCPRLDHSVSGRILMTPRTFCTPSHTLASYGLVGFPAAPAVKALTSPSEYTPWPVLQNVRQNIGDDARTNASRRLPSHRGSFHALPHHHHSISGPLHLPIWGAFQLSVTLLVHYRSQVVFSLGSW